MADNKVQFTISGKDNSKQAFDSAEKNAQSFTEKLSAMFSATGPLAGALVLIGALKSIGDAVGGFFKDSIKASADASVNFNLVSSALQNIGVNAKAMTPGVIDQIDQIANKTGQDKDAVEKVYAQLVRSTGNYKDALKLLPTVIGVSITAHQDLTSAARVTAEAYHGNTRALRSMGIAAKDGQTAIQALSDNVKGASDAFGQSTAGQLASFHNSLLTLKETIGDSITKSSAFSGVMNKLVGIMQELGQWFKEHQSAIQTFMHVLGDIGSILVDVIVFAVKEFIFRMKLLIDVGELLFSHFKEPLVNMAELWVQQALVIEQSLIPALTKFIGIVASLADKIGLHTFDGLQQSFSNFASDAEQKTQHLLTQLERFKQGGSFFDKDAETSASTSTSTPSVTGDNTLGKKTKQKHIHTADENKEFTEFLANLQKELDIQGLRANALAALTALQSQYNAVANDATKSVKERTDAEKHLQEITKIIDEDQRKADEAKKKAAEEQKKADAELKKESDEYLKSLKLELGFDDTRQKAQKELNALAGTYYDIAHNTTLDLQTRITAQEKYNQTIAAGAKAINEPLTASQALQESLTNIGNFAQTDFASAFQKAGDLTAKGFSKVAESAITGAKKSIGQEAQHRGELSLISAVEALAKGLLGDPNAFAAAATFAEAGASYLALASTLGAGGSANGSGAGGAGSARSNSGISSTQQLKNRTPGQIYIQGGLLNLNDPAQSDAFQKALENFTGQNVQIIPR